MRAGVFRLGLIWVLVGVSAAVSDAGEIPPGLSGAEVVARFAGGEITAAEVENRKAFKPAADFEAAVRDIALTRTLAAAAVEHGLDRDPETRRAIETARCRILVDALKRSVADEIVVTEDEIRAAYETGRDRYTIPKKYRLFNIFLAFPENAGPGEKAAVRDRMEALQRRILEGADFSVVARSESDSQTRYRGGLIGMVSLEQLRADVRKIVESLEPGSISEIVETGEGLTIFRCDRVREPRVWTFEEVRSGIETRHRRRKAAEAWRTIEAEARSTVPDRTEIVGPDLEEALAAIARERGLDRRPEVTAKLHWTALETLASHELERRVDARYEELSAEETKVVRAVAQKEGRLVERRVRLSVIRIEVGPRGDLRARYAFAEDLLERIETGELEFAEAARRFSDHPSAPDGGALEAIKGSMIWLRFGRSVAEAVSELRPGEIVLVQEEGPVLWIVRLDGRDEVERRSTGDVVERLRFGRRREISDAIIGEVADGLAIEIPPVEGTSEP